MDYKELKELIKAVSESNLTAFEVQEDGLTIKMSKETKVVESVVVESRPLEKVVSKAQEEVLCDTRENLQVEPSIEVRNNNKDENVEIVVSPIVGTFYTAPGPDDKPFVSNGDKVKKGDTLCIVEAMKLMNEITSEVDGTVIEMLVNNEDMVEYGQPIMKIRKD